jgi:MerR family transcriptional regulator, redox-sensitive transcriptional activator SoxR
MKIGEIAARAGLATSAIRYYEKAGLLKAPGRASGRRVYQEDVLHQLVIIRFAQQTGFTLKEIRLLLHGFPEGTPASTRWRKLAGRKIPELEATAQRARAMKKTLEQMLGCRCQKLEQCARGLARYVEQGGDSAKCC